MCVGGEGRGALDEAVPGMYGVISQVCLVCVWGEKGGEHWMKQYQVRMYGVISQYVCGGRGEGRIRYMCSEVGGCR